MKQMLYNWMIAQNGAGALSIQTMLLNFLAAGVLGLLIFIIYRMTHSGPVYSARFNVTLVMLTLITTVIMSVIGNNVALSLGMVGALSIVRFRTAVKDPRDAAYIFWTIAVGICCGVSDYLVAGVGSVMIFLFLVLFGFAGNPDRLLVIVRGSAQADDAIGKGLEGFFREKAALRVHSCTLEEGTTEYIYETTDRHLRRGEQTNGSLTRYMGAIEGVLSVSLVRQDDEMHT